MEFDKKNMTLEEAVAIIKEIEPQHERTNSGTAEGVILQAVHDSKIVPVVRCRDCKFATITADRKLAKRCSQWAEMGDLYIDADFFCACGQRRESVE